MNKKLLFAFVFCLLFLVIYKFTFCYILIKIGDAGHKYKTIGRGGVEYFPSCIINPFYYDKLKIGIKDFLNNDFKEYYKNTYYNKNDDNEILFEDLDNIIKDKGFSIKSIRETKNNNTIEIFVSVNHSSRNNIFIFNTEIGKIVGFY